MTYKLSLLAIVILIANTSFAQNVRLNAYSLGVFNDKIDSYYDNSSYYNGTIKGGFVWGAGIEFMARPNYGIELSYLRQDTKSTYELLLQRCKVFKF